MPSSPMSSARPGDPASVAAREAQVLADGPRILPLTEGEIDESAMTVSRRLTAAAGGHVVYTTLADIPEFVPTMLRHPALCQQIVETGIILLSKGQLPPRHRELAVLRVGWRSGAPYEWGEHVVIAKRHGITSEEIERVIEGPEASWTGIEQAVLRAVDELLTDAMISDATWAVLADHYSQPQLVELPMLVGQYQMVAYLQNSLRMRLSASNEGLAAR